jgi:hypothetical protein
MTTIHDETSTFLGVGPKDPELEGMRANGWVIAPVLNAFVCVQPGIKIDRLSLWDSARQEYVTAVLPA